MTKEHKDLLVGFDIGTSKVGRLWWPNCSTTAATK